MQSTEPENWKPVPGYEDLYEVSSLGRVRSLGRVDPLGRNVAPRVMKPAVRRDGYGAVALWRDGVKVQWLVHRLVLTAFVGECPPSLEGCHNDGNPRNNRLDNLRWDTRSENQLDRVKHGTHHSANLTHCTFGHPFEKRNLKNKTTDGRRRCLACDRARAVSIARGVALTKQLADEYYEEIVTGAKGAVKRDTPMGKRTHCPYGHSLSEPNLVPAGLRVGIRQCRACANGRKRAKSHGVPYSQELGDLCYKKIMGE